MEEQRTSDTEQDGPVVEAEARNRRDLRRLLLAVCLIATIALGVRLVCYVASRPPKIPPPLASVPGYYREEEVMAFITNGMRMTTVVSKYGSPSQSLPDSGGFTRHLWFPENIPLGSYRNAFCGFEVMETNGIVYWRDSVHIGG